MFFGKVLSICCIILFISLINGYPSNTDHDKCVNYCSNDAVCLMVDNNATCYCLPEWEGKFCDIVRQKRTNKPSISTKQITRNNLRSVPCDYVPTLCKNGGLCYVDDQTTKLACQCPYPYDGARCEEYSVCYNYCFNNGICTVNGEDPECECGEKFDGVRCQSIKSTTTIDPPTTTTDPACTYLPDGYCNGGDCVVNNGRISCQCPPTHTGDQCQTLIGGSQGPGPINPIITNPPIIIPGQTNPPSGGGSEFPCSINPCQNGRPCYNNGNTYYCFCGPQFGGNNCQFING